MTDQQGQAIIALLTEIRDLLKNGAGSGAARAASAPRTGSGTHFSKLKDDSWGVRTFQEFKPGETVKVETKSGQIQTRRLKAIQWQGQDRDTHKHVWLWSVYDRDEKAAAAKEESAPAAESAQEPPIEDNVPF